MEQQKKQQNSILVDRRGTLRPLKQKAELKDQIKDSTSAKIVHGHRRPEIDRPQKGRQGRRLPDVRRLSPTRQECDGIRRRPSV